MPLKSGAKHGTSFILGIILSVLLAEFIKGVFPDIMIMLNKVSLRIIRYFSIDFNVKTVSTLILAFIIVVFIGIAFGFMERKIN